MKVGGGGLEEVKYATRLVEQLLFSLINQAKLKGRFLVNEVLCLFYRQHCSEFTRALFVRARILPFV